MRTITPISLKRIAIHRMQQVESGLLTYDEALESIKTLMHDRSGLVHHLTRDYSEDLVKAFQFFRLL